MLHVTGALADFEKLKFPEILLCLKTRGMF